MKTWFLLAAPLLALTAIAPVNAMLKGPEYQECMKRSSQFEQVDCIKQRTAFWNNRVNKATETIQASGTPAQKKTMTDTLRVWQDERRKCGGRGGDPESNECQRSMMEDRAVFLEKMLAGK